MAYFLTPKISDSLDQAIGPSSDASGLSKVLVTPPQNVISADEKRDRPSKGRRSSSRPSSLGGWVKNILPSHRPERGGTHRSHGYWAEVENKEGRASRRVMTDSHQSLGKESINSNRITHWNTAKDLSEAGPSNPGPQYPRRKHRDWTGSGDELEDQLPVSKLGGILRGDHTMGHESNNGAIVEDAISGAGRRPSEAQRAIHRSLHSRRRRQNLKQSGDYLGVQGINPHTGQFDVMTPTDSTSHSSASAETKMKVKALRKLLSDNKETYGSPPARNEDEERFLLLQRRKEKMKSMGKNVRWQRRRGEWSSAQEPTLSPIAQSLQSTAPTSRKQSRVRGSKPRASSKGKLINLSSPPARPRHQSIKASVTLNTNASSSRSSGTVIKTPLRRSLAHATPTAWELFENGIRFDSSESSTKLNDAPANVPPPPNHEASNLIGSTGLPGHWPRVDEAPVQTSTISKPVTKLDDFLTASEGASFLGRRAGRGVHCEGMLGNATFRPKAISSGTHGTEPAMYDDSAPLWRGRSRNNIVGPQSNPKNAGTPSNGAGRSHREAAPQMLFPRKQGMADDGREDEQMAKVVQPRHQQSAPTLRRQALARAEYLTAVNRGSADSIIEQSAKQSQMLSSTTCGHLGREIRSPRPRAASLGQSGTRDTWQSSTQGEESDLDWNYSPVQSAGRARVDGMVEGSACIPTTTITGYGPQGSQSSRTEEVSREARDGQHHRRPLSRVLYNLPTLDSSSPIAETSHMQQGLNAWQNTTFPEEDVPEIGTTSRGATHSVEQFEELVKLMKLRWEEILQSLPRSQSHKSTSIQSQGFGQKSSKQDCQGKGESRNGTRHPCTKQGQELCPGPRMLLAPRYPPRREREEMGNERREAEMMVEMMDMEENEMEQEVESEGVESQEEMMSTSESSLIPLAILRELRQQLMGVPGSFPDNLDGEKEDDDGDDDTGSHSGVTVLEHIRELLWVSWVELWEQMPWRGPIEASGVQAGAAVMRQVVGVICLCWGFVRPMLNIRTLMARREEDEDVTWMDLAAALVAVPVAAGAFVMLALAIETAATLFFWLQDIRALQD